MKSFAGTPTRVRTARNAMRRREFSVWNYPFPSIVSMRRLRVHARLLDRGSSPTNQRHALKPANISLIHRRANRDRPLSHAIHLPRGDTWPENRRASPLTRALPYQFQRSACEHANLNFRFLAEPLMWSCAVNDDTRHTLGFL